MGAKKTFDGAENVYNAAEKWVECALRSDGSLFTPGTPIWTADQLKELRERFLDRHDDWKGPRFFEKLEPLLTGNRPEVIQLMAEVVYVTYLIVWRRNVGRVAKQRRINQVLSWSPTPVAIPNDLAGGLEPGIASPGAFFIANFAIHPGFIIEFMEQWKEKDSDEQDRLLTNPWEFKSVVMNVPFQSSVLRDNPFSPVAQRMALLHLVFPDTFEGILNPDHKFRIARSNSFSKYITKPDDDVDCKVQQVRNGLETKLDRDFDFYDQDVYNQWISDPNPWDDYVRGAKAYFDTGRLESDEIEYKIEIGRKLALARDEMFAGSDNWASQVDEAIPSGNIVHFIPKSNFGKWLVESPDEVLKAFREIWTRSESSASERIRAFCDILPDSVLGSGVGTRMNVASVLLMGLDVHQYPPYGYMLFKRAYERTGYDQPPQEADEATMYEHALSFLDRFIEEASQRGLDLRHRLDAQSLVWAIRNYNGEPCMDDIDDIVEPDLHSLAQELTLPVEFLEKIETLLEDKRQVIFQGPPGTGKTFVAQKLANHLAGSEDRVTLVQFHPSYSYEDFVQGFRPTLVNGQPGFELRNGPLLKAAEQARNDPDSQAKHFLIIDEINRGSLARILGELYFLLEYRDSEIDLQYSDEPFSLPPNLYIIGTMNTADRSIALVDLALRRRFYFVEFHPDDEPIKSVLRRWLEANAPRMARVADVVDLANQKLRDDRHAAIGPSYFMKPNLDGAAVERIWKHSVLPYIEERLFGDDDRIKEFDLSTLRQEIGRGDTSANGGQPEGQDGGE